MFGLFRLVLASLVTLTHFGFETHDISLGDPAVISFYMLSGVLMQRQFGKFLTQGNATSTFLIDLFLRVAPTYWAVPLLVVASLGGHDLIPNFTLFPLNYADFTGIETLIFPAWSLAAEVWRNDGNPSQPKARQVAAEELGYSTRHSDLPAISLPSMGNQHFRSLQHGCVTGIVSFDITPTSGRYRAPR